MLLLQGGLEIFKTFSCEKMEEPSHSAMLGEGRMKKGCRGTQSPCAVLEAISTVCWVLDLKCLGSCIPGRYNGACIFPRKKTEIHK